MGVLRAWRAFYGDNPLHLLSVIGCFALAGYAVSFVYDSPSAIALLIWFAGAVLGHDLLLYPLYALADQPLTISRWARRKVLPSRPPLVPAINHIRVPVLGSAVLGLIYFPTITQRGEDALRFTATVGTASIYGNWLLITGLLFVGSAVVYALRLGIAGGRLVVRRTRRPAAVGAGPSALVPQPASPVPAVPEPTANRPVADDPAADAPADADPGADQQADVAPTADDPAGPEPAVDEQPTPWPSTPPPVPSAPAAAESDAAEPADAAPTAGEPTAAEPADAAPTADEPAADGPTETADDEPTDTADDEPLAEPSDAEPDGDGSAGAGATAGTPEEDGAQVASPGDGASTGPVAWSTTDTADRSGTGSDH